MVLLPYTATALSRYDIPDTPNNRNVVQGAIVRVFDLQGVQQTIYDDDTGAGGELQKVTNLDGQRTFYIEPGSYTVDVNGRQSSVNVADASKVRTAIQPVASVADLRLLEATFDGQQVSLAGYYAGSTKGGGILVWDASSTAADDGGVTIAVAGVTTGRWVRQLGGFVTPEMFGARGDGVTADADAIIAAKNYASTVAPAGSYRIPIKCQSTRYLLDKTIRFNYNGIKFEGLGTYNTVFLRTDGNYGNTFEISTDTPASARLSNFELSGFCVECNAEMNNGSHIAISDAIHGNISDLQLWNGFISLSVAGLQNTTISNIKIKSGAFYPTLKVGSRFIQVLDAQNPSNETGEVQWSNINASSTGVGAGNIEYGLLIRACDGMWMVNSHFLGANEILKINPQSSDVHLQGLMFDNVWFDQLCSKNISIVGNCSGGYGNFQFNNCQATGATDKSVEITSGAINLNFVEFVGGYYGSNTGTRVFHLLQGDNVKISNLSVMTTKQLTDAANTKMIEIGVGSTDVAMSNLQVGTNRTDSKPSIGIEYLAQSNNITMNDIRFKNIDTEVVTASVLNNGNIAGNLSTNSAGFSSLIAAASVAIPHCSTFLDLTGVSAEITDLTNCWDGRKIAIRAKDSPQTFKHNAGSSTTRIYTNTGNDVILGVNKAAWLTYSRTAPGWYLTI